MLITADTLSIVLAFLFAIELTHFYHADLKYSPWHQFFHFGPSKFFGIFILLVFWYQEQYNKRRPFWEEVLQIYKTVAFFFLVNLGLSFILGKSSLKVMIVGFWLSVAFLVPVIRLCLKLVLYKFKLWQRDLYILGCGKTALNAYKLFASNKLMGYNLQAFVTDKSLSPNKINEFPGNIIDEMQLLQQLEANKESDVIVAMEHAELSPKINFINYLQHNCKSVLVLPEISGLALYGAQIDHFFGNDQLVLRLNNNLSRKLNVLLKRSFDLILVSIGLIILSPVLLIIAALIKYYSGSKVFYFHERVGKNGKPFYCIKFQTMYPNSHELLEELLDKDPEAKNEWEQSFKLKNDPRVTPIGKWLRKTSLDELPQLFNVFMGNMSLVGPRPIIDKEVERYKDGYYYYKLVLPGVTGLWQVSGRSEVNYADRVRLDEWYVKNWSLWYDIVILIKTIGVVIKRNGAY